MGTYKTLRIRKIFSTEIHFRTPLGTAFLGTSLKTHILTSMRVNPTWKMGDPLTLQAILHCTKTNSSGLHWKAKQRLSTVLGTEIPEKPLSMSRWAFSGFGFSFSSFIGPKEHMVAHISCCREESDKRLTLSFANSFPTYWALVDYLPLKQTQQRATGLPLILGKVYNLW